jgi:hypothetical protein
MLSALTHEMDIYGDTGISLLESTNKAFVMSLVVYAILAPYTLLITQLAKCESAYREGRSGCCYECEKCSSMFCLLFLSILSVIFIIVGVLFSYYLLDTMSFVQSFWIANIIDYLAFFMLGISNWMLLSWEGFLVIPQFPMCGGFPPRFMPLLGIYPIKLFLNSYYLGESTYLEDKKKFEEQYSGKKSIDEVASKSIDAIKNKPVDDFMEDGMVMSPMSRNVS